MQRQTKCCRRTVEFLSLAGQDSFNCCRSSRVQNTHGNRSHHPAATVLCLPEEAVTPCPQQHGVAPLPSSLEAFGFQVCSALGLLPCDPAEDALPPMHHSWSQQLRWHLSLEAHPLRSRFSPAFRLCAQRSPPCSGREPAPLRCLVPRQGLPSL